MPARSRLFIALTVLCASSLTFAADQPSRVLYLTQSKGFQHGSVTRRDSLAPAEVALVQLGEKTGLFRVDCTQDAEADFTKENLQNYDIVALYTTGGMAPGNKHFPIKQEDLDYFLNDWARQPGHGILGFHAATDTYADYEPYWDMIGGSFLTHPWFANTTVTLTNDDPDNPLSKPFGDEFVIKDEIYMYTHWQPEKVRVLLSLDYAKSPAAMPVPVDHGYHVPVCWIKEYGQGRVYYNNLGHNEVSWTNPSYLDSITQAVKWIRGELEVDATPNPEVSKAREQESRKNFVEHGFKVLEQKK